MLQSRLTAVFSTLDAAEKAGLRKFVESPYHNSREDVIRLVDFLIKYSNKKDMLDKAIAFPYLFPHRAQYDDFSVRQAMTFLLRLIERFLVVERLRKDQVHQKITLAQV
ncbi:MAG: hypothetical protein AAGD05_19495, partial [Bacteroidota bacterium]